MDLGQAKHVYGATLGFDRCALGVDGGVFLTGGGGTLLRVYERRRGVTLAARGHDDRRGDRRRACERGPRIELPAVLLTDSPTEDEDHGSEH